MARYVSLFRAINVGGNNQVKMAALKAMHETLGFRNVSTYLQTGNVVFESDEIDLTQLVGLICNTFEQQFGFHSEVIVRTAAQIKDLLNHNPFLNQPEKEMKWIVVMFLASSPEILARQALLESYAGPEELFISDQELYIYYTNGIGRSKLSNMLIERKLKVLGTGRNWNTVIKLLEMTQSVH